MPTAAVRLACAIDRWFIVPTADDLLDGCPFIVDLNAHAMPIMAYRTGGGRPMG